MTVRAEYARLARDFVRLARGFGIEMDEAAREDVCVLAASLECIDRVIDAMPDRAGRDRLGATLVTALRDGSEVRAWGDEMRARFDELRAIVERRRVVAAFARAAEEALANVEAMRSCMSVDEYVSRVALEGRLTASMALLVAGDACGGDFARFFVALGEPANFVDKLLDARGDAARGEIALRPGARLHGRLFCELLRRLPALLRLCPRRVWLLAWGAGYLLAP